MRMLLKAVLDTQAANEVFRSGAASEALDRIQEALQPEALYGFVEDGQRAFFAVFDLADPSEIPVISEPLYQRANVKLTRGCRATPRTGADPFMTRRSQMEGRTSDVPTIDLSSLRPGTHDLMCRIGRSCPEERLRKGRGGSIPAAGLG
jgi:hypothetical protein